MIADLRGKRVLIAAPATKLSETLVEIFRAHGAECARTDSAHFETTLASLSPGGPRIDAVIHAGSAEVKVDDFESYQRDDLLAAIAGSTWPLFEGLRRIKAMQGTYPRYAIGLSSPSPNRAVAGADFVAAGDAVLETLCRYATYRLVDEDLRINVIRHVRDASPADSRPAATFIEVAQAAVALCSGWMDAVRGQVLTVDRGATFANTVMRLYDEHTGPSTTE